MMDFKLMDWINSIREIFRAPLMMSDFLNHEIIYEVFRKENKLDREISAEEFKVIYLKKIIHDIVYNIDGFRDIIIPERIVRILTKIKEELGHIDEEYELFMKLY